MNLPSQVSGIPGMVLLRGSHDNVKALVPGMRASSGGSEELKCGKLLQFCLVSRSHAW